MAKFLRHSPDTQFDLLVSVTAVDFIDHFDMVYHLRSLAYNTFGTLKCSVGWGRKEPTVASLAPIWRGADLQEREVWDLMGIHFEGRASMKRVFLWEGFPGHPLRKDFVEYSQSLVPDSRPVTEREQIDN